MEFTYYDEINEKLKSALNHHRYVHTLGVAYTSAALAMRYHYDTDKALLAGLLHDCAKCFSDEEKLELCREGGVQLTESEISNPALIHAKLGVYIAQRDYDVHDQEILDAIRSHTTGEPEMSLLQKIVFTADLIEPNRDNVIPGIDMTRKMAFTDIDECIYMITKQQLEYLESQSGKTVDPMTRETYNYYLKVHNRSERIKTLKKYIKI